MNGDGHPEFGDGIEAQHERIDRSKWDRIYVVGDVHGCREELERLLSALDPTPEDLVVFVGDLVRKGPDSRGVVELVRSSPNMRSVRGNNEEKLLRGEKRLPGLERDDLDWIAALPVAISWEGSMVVHAGVDPRKPIAGHTVEDLQNVRSLAPGGGYTGPYWFDEHEGPSRVFFGHTVLEEPIVRPNAVGLDTGCVYGGSLTAYEPRREETVRVDANRTYSERPDEKFLSPAPNSA